MANHPNRSKPTAFMQFWEAINKALKHRGIPEITYGPARDLAAQPFSALWPMFSPSTPMALRVAPTPS